ncbi:MAG: hypothetical protein IKS83_08815 [Victivallales bacterium]|nr:hypothetical protein [Victivallales bacterium]
MSSEIIYSDNFPAPPARLFFVGIGGIGMSGLAQFLRWQGYAVAGSDRGLAEPARAQLYAQLRAQGIALYPQDGSGPRDFQPDAFVVSTAIEPDNADLAAAPQVPIFHRAFTLARACERQGATLIGVAGSCGKTSVTGWIASALKTLGRRIVMIDGGYTLDFEDADYPGNFFAEDTPGFIVAEIDESDKSIREFSPEYAVVLNVGHDHYGMDELREVFRAFLSRAKRGAVYPATEPSLKPAQCPSMAFQEEAPGYAVDAHGIHFEVASGVMVHSLQAGQHSAWNGQAVFALLRQALPEASDADLATAMGGFRGVRQRFEIMSNANSPVAVINDFAHNPEKLTAAISAARERYGSPLAMVWQPHGFKALGDQREALQEALRGVLRPEDQFLMLPVYYAGGTTSGKPTSLEVCEQYAASGLPVEYVATREAAEARFRAMTTAKAWLVLGARDASLRTWSKALAKDN